MNSRLVLPLREGCDISLAEIGGKAASLMRMSNAGLPVPAGVVLTSAFFAPWVEEIMASEAWSEHVAWPRDDWTWLDTLRRRASALPFTPAQAEALNVLHSDLAVSNNGARFAVRSSSPDEDTTSASFAGLYKTRLGVPAKELEDALRECFASAIDPRVIAYKHERRLDPFTLRFAAIVQRQIDSDVAGIAFSLNPDSNDYDEAVVSSNWGLGSSVVDGRVSADHFVVDKVSGRILAERRGGKEVSVRLDPAGGTVERSEDRSAERTLDDGALAELTSVIARIESLYGCPVDVEWAYAGGVLHLLQARPITTYVPLPPQLVTQPGERRRLYADGALSKGLSMNTPVSVLGLDAIERSLTTIISSWIGPIRRRPPPEEALFLFAGARMYSNVSNLLWLVSPRMLAKANAPNDMLMSRIVAAIDRKQYRSAVRPAWIGANLLWLLPRLVWGLRGFLWRMGITAAAPERAHRAYRRTVENLEAALRAAGDEDLPLDELQRHGDIQLGKSFNTLMAALIVGQWSPKILLRRRSAEDRALAEKFERGAPGNVVVEMGTKLHQLAHLVDPAEFEDLPRLAERITQRQMPIPFLSAWDEFVSRFGFRGPQEMDLASPRYADDQQLMLEQMAQMAVAGGLDPESLQRQHARDRGEAYDALMRRFGPLRRMLLRRLYRLNEHFAGTRETPKYLGLFGSYGVRHRALADGRRLVEAGRLDTAAHVFDFTFDELKRAHDDPTLDLRNLREDRDHFARKLRAHVRLFPPVIDSRGRILRPAAPDDEPGLLRGMAVSSGVAIGPVKILQRADAKRIEKGDIFVAYTTDPGWTPLFVNAAAVVLQVGGVLQHGAIIAREYGKPCVVGIDRVVEQLQDGDIVEVDGTAGTVRIITPGAKSRIC